ncbi:MAG: gamma-glutamyltransferase [Rhodospirillales bacterium]|nr:gamma-glutamyltransferase [Rhodospirillales bacterium]
MARHCAAAVVTLATVAACDTVDDVFDNNSTPRGVPIAEGFFGGVAGDDPRSVLVAREVLARGGTAADAVVAYYFMAAVSYPSTSSLGAGGVCMSYEVFDEGRAGQLRFIDFRVAPIDDVDPSVIRPTAVPGAVRGLFLLHADGGVTPWQDLVAPAERAARFGVPVSRALARDLAMVGDVLLADPEARRVFSGSGGGVLREGETIVQLDLSAMLSNIRTRGAGDFYVGFAARQFSEAVQSIGMPLTLEDMRDYSPLERESYTTEIDQALLGAAITVHVPGDGFDSGSSTLAAYEMLSSGDALDRALANGSADHLIAEVSLRTAVARAMRPGASPDPVFNEELMSNYNANSTTPIAVLPAPPAVLTESPAASSVAAVDSFGNAATCVFSMNNLFGNGRVAPGTGILLAAEPGGNRGDGLSLLPVISVNENVHEVIFAGSVSGGVVSGPVMATVLVQLMEADTTVGDAVARPRVFHPGLPDLVVVESTVGDAALNELVSRGHEVQVMPELGRVNAIYCPEGLRNGSESCAVTTDPRAFGLAAGG